jgi:hypothetical protein
MVLINLAPKISMSQLQIIIISHSWRPFGGSTGRHPYHLVQVA